MKRKDWKKGEGDLGAVLDEESQLPIGVDATLLQKIAGLALVLRERRSVSERNC